MTYVYTCTNDKYQHDQVGMNMYEVSDMEKLNRFLCLGTEIGYYKTNSQNRKFSRPECNAIDRLILNGQGLDVVRCIQDISVQGRAFRQNPALYALAMCARSYDLSTKHAAYSVLNDVCRIPTHLFQFIKYCEEMTVHDTGWGRAHRNAISQWYKQFVDVGPNSRKNPLKLAHLVTKYRQRFKWTHKDVIRLAHVRSKNKAIRITLQYALGKKMEVADSKESAEVGQFLVAVQEARRCSIKKEGDEDRLCEIIAVHALSMEHVPTQFLKDSIKVWGVLLRMMSMTPLIKNLGKITHFLCMYTGKGDAGNAYWAEHVARRLDDDVQLKRARIHPLTLLIAIKHYEQGTKRNKRLSWTPHPRITWALQNAFIRNTRIIQPIGMKYLMAISVGENMQKHICDSTITAAEAAAAMAYSTIRTEDVEVILFNNRSGKDGIAIIAREDTLQSIEDKIYQISVGMGSHCIEQDLSVPFIWAAQRKKKFDAILLFTDSITSCGYIHPAEALKQYTEYMAIPDYRFVVVAMTSDKYSVAAPDSIHNLDVVGFDKMTPSLIMDFVGSSNSEPVFLTDDNMMHADEDLFYDIH